MEECLTKAAGLGAGALAAKHLIEKGSGWLDALLAPGAKEAGRALADAIAQYRIRHQAQMLNRTRQLCFEMGYQLRRPSTRFLLPLLEGAGDTEEPDLQEMWARLLAAAIGNQKNEHPRFVQWLKSISPTEAQLLTHARRFEADIEAPDNWPPAQLQLCVSCLHGLGLFEYCYASCDKSKSARHKFVNPVALQGVNVRLSPLAKHFLDIVQP